jgi:putative SOS response-associated peptidase YedK
MCGRFTLTSNLDDLQGRFGFLAGQLDYRPHYNVAPTQQVLAVVNDGQRRAELLRWGLIPFWAKDPKIGYRMINAVGETVASKPAFRAAFRRRRCLVLADGFFEWRKVGKKKIPTYIFLKSREPFAFAGIWETWKALDGETVRSCAILTTEPNAFMEPIHNRMPVILSEETEALWLDPMTEEASVLAPLLTPSPPELMDSYPVSDLVNSPKNYGPECIQQLSGSDENQFQVRSW